MEKRKIIQKIRKSFEVNSFAQVQQLTLKIMLFIMAAISLMMIPLNLYVSHNYPLIAIDIFISILSATVLYKIFQGGDYLKATYVGLFILFVSFNAIACTQEGKNFSLIWSYFFSPFAIITLGARNGIKASVLFFLTLSLITYNGIGIWLEGTWNHISFFRFELAHLGMMAVIYTMVKSNERAFYTIEQLRKKDEEQRKEFERLSITDPLTSLYNRRFLKQIFPKELISARMNHQYFAFFLLDIDHFKQFNDTYGHQAGDRVLEHIANLFHEYIKYGFRIGGDEFAGIVVANDEQTLKEDIEDFYRATCLSNLSIDDENIQLKEKMMISCSMGVHIDNNQASSYEEIFEKADQALYRAKEMGRNRIVYL